MKWNLVTFADDKFLNRQKYLEEYAKSLDIGTYSYSNYGAHVLMALILGFLGYIFIKVNIPPIPIVLGFVMSPIIEQNLNRALTIHNGDLSNVLFRPITLTILFLALITIIYGVTTRR